MKYIQEAVNITAKPNYIPVPMRYRLPTQTSDTSIFLLSNSFEYDIELIKNMPPPRTDYKSIIIPYRINNTFSSARFNFSISQSDYNNKVKYIGESRIIPRLNIIKLPYPRKISNNIYIPISEVFQSFNSVLRNMDSEYIRDNIFDMFNQLLNNFNFSKQKVLIVDTTRFKIYKDLSDISYYKTDLLNALLTSYFVNWDNTKSINLTIIFRNEDADYKFDLSKFDPRYVSDVHNMISRIGKTSIKITDIEESIDDFDTNIDKDTDSLYDDDSDTPEEVDEDIKKIQSTNKSITNSVKTSIDKLMNKFKVNNNDNDMNKSGEKQLYDAKTLKINTDLLTKINPSHGVVSNYKTIANDLTNNSENAPVENKLLEDTAKELSTKLKPTNTNDTINTTSSVREQRMRSNIGQIKLNNINIDTLSSVTDVPLPPPITPLRMTTTNIGALKGTSFSNIAKAYEDELLDNDIVSTFMNLSNLPDGFFVEDIDVTDISNVTSLIHNWRVKLKSKNSGKQQVINVRVPKVINGRFYINGIWYNIGKQDFPIPILKISDKKVMLTSNYNKITVERYDTRSLVDINSMRKVINKITNENGENAYVKVGNSIGTNMRYISTIEYDEYAKQWFSFIDKESKCEIYFNRQKCEQLYSFVTTNEDEFCCGMINQVPIVLNTETGLTRDERTLTDTMLSVLPPNVRDEYAKIKPGKMSMYSEILIGIKLPLGVTASAWEGLSTFLKKTGCKYQYVDKSFNDSSYFIIPFKDKNLAISNTVSNQLLFNGFYRINTKAYTVNDFETPIMDVNSVYVDIFNQIFFKQYSQLTTLITYYNFFVDAITKDVCSHYNIPNDIVGMLIYASNLLADNSCSSESNATLYRIRSTEIIPAIIHYRLAYAISKYNNAAGSKSHTNMLVFNPNEVIHELIAVTTVEPLSALNPIIELQSRNNISKKGFRGQNSDRSYSLDKRTYNESMIGKMAISSPNNNNVGISRQLVVDPKIDSVRGYTSLKSVDEDYNDLQLASFAELLTAGTVTSDDAIRTAIATSQSEHIVPTSDSEPVIISNGVDELVASCVTDEFAVVAEDDGVVIEIADGYMIIQYKDGKKKAININDRYSFNPGSGNYVNNKLLSNFQTGDKFKKQDILAYHEKFFTKDSTGIIRANIGPRMRVAFAGIYSTYEDAGFITKSASKRLSTKLATKRQIKLSASDDIEKIVQVGDEIEINDPLVVFGLGDTGDKSVDNFLKAFQSNDTPTSLIDNAKRIIKSSEAGTVVDVKMYTVKSMDKLSPSLHELLSAHFKSNIKKRKILDKHDKSDSVFKLDTLYDAPTGPLKGSTIKGITCDVLIEISIEHEDLSSVGDKLVVYGASKQITSEVIPEGQEPYSETEPDKEISLFVAPDSILKRMIPSITKIAPANRILTKSKEVIRNIWNE